MLNMSSEGGSVRVEMAPVLDPNRQSTLVVVEGLLGDHATQAIGWRSRSGRGGLRGCVDARLPVDR